MYEALIARLRARADDLVWPVIRTELTDAADALERIQKMQPVAYLCNGQVNRVNEPCPECVPLYRFPIGEDK
jgi:hypothetical protein